MSVTAPTEQELAAARQIIAAAIATVGTKNTRLPRDYHGPIDLSYERGVDVREFPRMVYKASKVDPRGYITRVVQSQEQQDALPRGWISNIADVHAFLDPLVKAQYVSADDIEGEQPEEREASRQEQQAEKG